MRQFSGHTPAITLPQMADSKPLMVNTNIFNYQLGVISKIKAAKRYALTKLMSNSQKSSSSTTSLTSSTDESLRQRSQTRTTSSRTSYSHSKSTNLKFSSRSESEESSFKDDESSSDEEENEDEYRPGNFVKFIIIVFQQL